MRKKGYKHTLETKEKLRQAKLGPKNPNWVDGLSTDKEQRKKKMKEYYRSEKGKEAYLRWQQGWLQENKEKVILSDIRCSARDKKLEFNLTVEDIVIPAFCPILDLKLIYGKGKGRIRKLEPGLISIDRIDPNKGYIKGNIQIISWLANNMKNCATPADLLKFADWIYKTYKK